MKKNKPIKKQQKEFDKQFEELRIIAEKIKKYTEQETKDCPHSYSVARVENILISRSDVPNSDFYENVMIVICRRCGDIKRQINHKFK